MREETRAARVWAKKESKSGKGTRILQILHSQILKEGKWQRGRAEKESGKRAGPRQGRAGGSYKAFQTFSIIERKVREIAKEAKKGVRGRYRKMLD